MSLSERLRPDIEAAPWVIEEVKALEAEIEQLRTRLAVSQYLLTEGRKPPKESEQ